MPEYLQNNSWILLLAGVTLITMALMMRLAKRRRAMQTERVTGRERTESLRQQRGMRGDLEDLMVEIEQLAKRLGTQLDAKAMRLEKLLDEADCKMAALQSMRNESPPESRENASGDERPAVIEEPSDAEHDRLTRHVYQLADRGLPAMTIARELNEHVGKIELILALRKA